MFAIIQDRSGQELARYPLADTDPLDPDFFADRFSSDMGITLEGEEPGSAIPDGGEDISITLQEEPGSPCCWTSANYMIAAE